MNLTNNEARWISDCSAQKWSTNVEISNCCLKNLIYMLLSLSKKINEFRPRF